jgi:sulfite reductase beta subunit-like hemoprotein
MLLREKVRETELLSLAEATVRVFARHAPQGRRLKYVARTIGPERLRELIEADFTPPAFVQDSLAGALTADTGVRLDIPVFAGELEASQLRRIAATAANRGDGMLMLTANQDLALFLTDTAALAAARTELAFHGLLPAATEVPVACRICPGSHECRMGLAPTRDVARQLLAALGPQARTLTWAISGCPNSCSQPQLADVGIMTSRRVKAEDGSRTPRFDLYRRSGDGLGTAVASGLDLTGLLQEIDRLG